MQGMNVIERKLRNANDLKSVVTIMKAAAASSIHKFEDAVEASSKYHRTIEYGLHILMRRTGFLPEFSRPNEDGLRLVFIFGSRQGMCGQFNESLMAYADQRITGWKDETLRVVALGGRIVPLIQERGASILKILPLPNSAPAIRPFFQRLLPMIETWRRKSGAMIIELYAQYKGSGASFHPDHRSVLPLDPERLKFLAETRWPSSSLPEIPEGKAVLAASLIREHIYLSLYQAAAESLASENASRLASMQAAEQQIEEQIASWHTRYNTQRQRAVTEELLDIVSGYEVLRK